MTMKIFKSDAIAKLYSNVVAIYDRKDGFVCKDKDGNEVSIDLSAVDEQYNKMLYIASRANEYPSVVDQLDMQYWDKKNGTTTWVDAVTKVKSDNPKP
mgnify:CR=1 FL=1|tara:strand:+ start:1505 stop:1798 length:294 start_codon:yes stop_codon:yes gene_type:complete